MVLHVCGHLKALLPDLARIPVRAFEAFTSPTVGNTSLLDGRLGCPNTCLIGGTNAALWMEPADAIIAQIRKDLDVLPHHRGIVVTSAGVMPPACKPETIKKVGDWVKAYPVRM
jgi:uroporphyrinogen-III decarboxylase